MESFGAFIMEIVRAAVAASILSVSMIPYLICYPTLTASLLVDAIGALFDPSVLIGWASGSALVLLARKMNEVDSGIALYWYGALYTFATTLCAMVVAKPLTFTPQCDVPYHGFEAAHTILTAFTAAMLLGGPSQLFMFRHRA